MKQTKNFKYQSLIEDLAFSRGGKLGADILSTPLGDMMAVWSAQGLCLLEFVEQANLLRELRHICHAKNAALAWDNAPFHWQNQLDNYFSGSLKQFDVPLDFVGTDFQQAVWRQLCRIPYGETISYGQQAQALGNPKAVRAVAAANGQNKISIVVPCHRVIGSNGKLTGYAGGLWRKQALLQLETPSGGQIHIF